MSCPSMTRGRSALRRLRTPTSSRSSGTASTTIAPSEKTRELQVRLDADVSPENWDELYGWLVAGLLRMRAVAGLLGDIDFHGA